MTEPTTETEVVDTPVEATSARSTFDITAAGEAIVNRVREAQRQLDENPFEGAPPKLVDHPLTHIITWLFEEAGCTEADKWVAGSKATVIGGPIEYRNIANNELRRILALGEISGKVNSFDMLFLLNRDPGTVEWLQTLKTYTIPFILEHGLLELSPGDFLNRDTNQVGV